MINMKTFFTIFSFTYIQNIKSKWFVLMSIIGIILIGLLINIGSIFNLIFPKTVTKIAVYEDGRFGITADDLKKVSTDKLVLEKVDQNKADKIKDTLKAKDSEYKGIVLFKDEKSSANFHINSSDPDLINTVSNFVSNKYTLYKAQKASISGNTYDYLFGDAAINVVKENKASETNFGLVMIMLILLYVVILYYGSITANSIIEEKSNRIMETLITAAKPSQLFIGKILGVCCAGISQVLVLIASFMIMSKVFKQEVNAIEGLDKITNPAILMYFIVFALLGYLLYSMIYGALGSMVSSSQDAAQAQMPMTIILMFVYLLAITASSSPENFVIKVLSYIPFFTPILMFERLILSSVAGYELIISIAILIVSIAVIGIISSKIYKKGVLHYGKGLPVLKILKMKS